MSASKQPHGIALGYPFDQLFDRQCELALRDKIGPSIRAIKLPGKEEGPGTGNIVITGPPGSGKSTLALQWAVKCALREDNQSNAAYFSLETSMDEIITKARPFLWHIWLREMQNLESGDEFLDEKGLGERLKNLLIKKTEKEQRYKTELRKLNFRFGRFDGGDTTRRVLLCSLSPRSLSSGVDHEELFWRRYNQLERLLAAASWLSVHDCGDPRWNRFVESKTEEGPKNMVLPMVVIDSLNMFGARPLNRDEIFRVFSLFRRYQRVGVFVVESTQDSPFDSTMADVVVSLSIEQDRGYLVQHLEVQKSRYFNHVPGLHPYKTLSLFSEKQLKDGVQRLPPLASEGSKPNFPRQGIVVYPSLHYVVLRTERTERPIAKSLGHNPIKEREYFCIDALKTVLPKGLLRGSVLALEGPRGTFKTSFALNFLGNGLRLNESALLIRFSDIALLKPKAGVGRQNMIAPQKSRELAEEGFDWEEWSLWNKEEPNCNGFWNGLAAPHKMTLSVWRRTLKGERTLHEPTLFEMDFKGGMLMPEEFVEIIRNLFIRRPFYHNAIKRVVLDDVSQIGVSYPFLRHSITTGDIFLSAFAHIMRNLDVDLMITGTTGGVAAADEIVSRACSLADAVVSFRICDVFGARHIVVSGEGIRAGRGDSGKAPEESPPAVVRFRGDEIFEVDGKHLQGLVGFETGRIHRPGLFIHLFQGFGVVHEAYNKGIKAMLEAGFASSSKLQGTTPFDSGSEPVGGQVEMVTFSARQSSAIQAAVDSFHKDGRPLDRTVIFTVDEFNAPIHDSDTARDRWIKVPGKTESDNADANKPWQTASFPTKSNDDLDWKEFLLRDENLEWPGLVWPYYSNVLLLAYRMDALNMNVPADMHCWKSWKQVEELARKVLSKGKKSPADKKSAKSIQRVPPIKRGFWVDLSSPETLSCLLLDALQAAQDRRDENFEFLIRRKGGKIVFDGKNKLSNKEKKELKALRNLLKQTGGYTKDEESPLPRDAGVYACWYSQLRDLIRRDPTLATKLHVRALPGGGFRGDWFAGIVKGSVSPALGKRIINKLCSREEDHSRYVEGVGLPARKLFYNEKFFAWPRGKHITLAKIKNIWKRALRRGKIGMEGDYECIRADIYAIARQLTRQSGPVSKPDMNPETLLETVGIERLFYQIYKLLEARDSAKSKSNKPKNQ